MPYDLDLTITESPNWPSDMMRCVRAMGRSDAARVRLTVPPRRRAIVKKMLHCTGFQHVFVTSNAVRCVE